jgi:hypothetical protein
VPGLEVRTDHADEQAGVTAARLHLRSHGCLELHALAAQSGGGDRLRDHAVTAPAAGFGKAELEAPLARMRVRVDDARAVPE